MRLIFIIKLFGCATIVLTGCNFVLRGYTNSSLLFPADIQDRLRIDKGNLRLYPLQVLYDSTDLRVYNVRGYRFDSLSINQVKNRIAKRFESFWLQETGVPTQVNRLDNLSKLVNAQVHVRQRPMGDQNNNTAYRSITRITSNYLSPDTLYHLVAEATLRLDICVGCASDGWQKDLFAVLHLRYAVLHKNEVHYYREIIVPKPIEGNKSNIRNTNAVKCFNEVLDRVMLFYLKRDIGRLIN